MTSVHLCYNYKLNKKVVADFRILRLYMYINVNEGLHYYVTEKAALNEYKRSIGGNRLLVKCIIPEGTRFYDSFEEGVGVCEALTVVEKVAILKSNWMNPLIITKIKPRVSNNK